MKLAWDQMGEGRPVALLHGFTGSRLTWGVVADRLAHRHRVIRVDLPGHGDSTAPAESFAQAADGIAQALTEASADPVDLVGYSLGARLALMVALSHPDRVRCLILESGSAGLSAEAERAARLLDDAKWIALLDTNDIGAFVGAWERVPVLSGLTGLPVDERGRIRAIRLQQRTAALAEALRTLGLGAQPDLEPHLRRLRAPTLLLTGSRDLRFTTLGMRLVQQIANARLCVVPECGHAPHLEAPDRWLAEVTRFLGSSPTVQRALEVHREA